MNKMTSLHITKQTGARHTATVIFFHGSGSSGDHMKQWVQLVLKNFSFPHIKVMYPTAPLQSYTPLGGLLSNVWFDREDVDLHAPEKLESINSMGIQVKDLIKNENSIGIPSNRIIVGGFSMGGSLSFHAGYRWDRKLAGTFVYSSFLNKHSIVYKELKETRERLPPLLQLHGDVDDIVDVQWGSSTFNELKAIGVQGEFHILEKLGHSINRRGMLIVKEWIEKLLPEI